MSPRRAELIPADAAPLFQALGDRTRLALLGRLSEGGPRSIAELTAGTGLTRQGVTKHLRILESARMVASRRIGRESRFILEPSGLRAASDHLTRAAAQWDDALARLSTFLEQAPD